MSKLDELRNRARTYFERARAEVVGRDSHSYDDVWQRIGSELQNFGLEIITELADLATSLAPIMRRSPLLSEVDTREAGNAVKGMRASIKFRKFQHWDASLMHDEDRVLGIRLGGESNDELVRPDEAAQLFEVWAEWLQPRLELLDPHGGDLPALSLMPATSVAAGFKPNTAFIMMNMSRGLPELTDVANTIKRCFSVFGVAAVRSDDIEHADVTTERIVAEIKTSEFLIADLTGERPSVYYELGVAHSLGKRPILVRRKETPIHFDVVHYNCPEYSNLAELEQLLTKRLESMTGRTPHVTL